MNFTRLSLPRSVLPFELHRICCAIQTKNLLVQLQVRCRQPTHNVCLGRQWLVLRRVVDIGASREARNLSVEVRITEKHDGLASWGGTILCLLGTTIGRRCDNLMKA